MLSTAGVTLDAEALSGFLAYLTTQSFAAGPSEWLRAHRLLAEMRGIVPAERWKTMLCPIFARDAAEQERFYQAYQFYFQGETPASAPSLAKSAAPGLEAPPTLRAAKKPQLLWFAMAVAVCACIAAWFYFQEGPRIARLRAPFIVPVDTPPPSVPQFFKWVEQEYRENILRPCAGWECVIDGYRPLAILSPLLLCGLYLWLIHPKMRRARLRAADREPHTWEVTERGPPLPREGDFLTAARVLRRRLSGDIEALDVESTLRETIRAAGFPSLRFRKVQSHPQYLVLIDRKSPGDHFATYCDVLTQELRRESLILDRYFFSGDPRSASHEAGSANQSLERLAGEFRDYRLLLIGEGVELLDPETGQPATWTRTLNQWQERALLTPKPQMDWGPVEAQLGAIFIMRPFGLRYMAELVEAFESPLRAGMERLTATTGEYPPPPADLLGEPGPGADTLLSMFFDPRVFEWLCACAIHSELEWKWTLTLAGIVDPSGRLLTEQNLLSLIRLPWFRKGAIPGRWRQVLSDAIDPGLGKQVRQALIEHIERYRAPEGSLAWRKQGLSIAVQRYFLAPDTRTRAALEAAMRDVPDVDIGNDQLLAELRRQWTQGVAGEDAGFRVRVFANRLHLSGYKTPIAILGMIVLAILLLRPVPVTREQVTKRGHLEPVSQVAASARQPIDQRPPSANPEVSIRPVPPLDTTPAKSPPRHFTPPASVPASSDGTAPLGDAPDVNPSGPAAASGSLGGLLSPTAPPAPSQGARVPGMPTYAVSGASCCEVVVKAVTFAGLPVPGNVKITLNRVSKAAALETSRPAAALGFAPQQSASRPSGYFVQTVRFAAPFSAIQLTGVPAGEYSLQLEPDSFDAQKISFQMGVGGQLTFAFGPAINPKSVTGIRPPAWKDMPVFKYLLDNAAYDALDDQRKACLLNIEAKMGAMRGVAIYGELEKIRDLQRDRLLASPYATLSGVIEISTLFHKVSGALHPAPSGFNLSSSFRSNDQTGSIQFTFFSNKSGEELVDIDIDAKTGLGHTFDVIRGALGSDTTNPYLIYQVLLSNGIDPLYQLVVADIPQQQRQGSTPSRKKSEIPKKEL